MFLLNFAKEQYKRQVVYTYLLALVVMSGHMQYPCGMVEVGAWTHRAVASPHVPFDSTRVESLCCMVPRVRYEKEEKPNGPEKFQNFWVQCRVSESFVAEGKEKESETRKMEVKKKKIVGVDHGEVIETWLKKHRLIYTGATRHPLILSIRDGTVHISSFKRWLGQDYIFVRAFVPFAASVLIKAWKESDNRNDMEVLLRGLAALNDEIAWFKQEAAKWDVQLSDIVPQKKNEEYCRFLESLMSPEVEYTVAITAYWAIEAVYQESFAHCLEDGSKTPPELIETCQRWGNEGFGQYCSALRNIANRRLEKVSDDLLEEGLEDVLRKAEVVFLRVLEYEVDFWNMSRGDSS